MVLSGRRRIFRSRFRLWTVALAPNSSQLPNLLRPYVEEPSLFLEHGVLSRFGTNIRLPRNYISATPCKTAEWHEF